MELLKINQKLKALTKSLILLVGINLLTGCFSFAAPKLDDVAPPIQTTQACPVLTKTPMPELPTAQLSPCPIGTSLEWCFDKTNADNLKQRIIILHNAAMDCHS